MQMQFSVHDRLVLLSLVQKVEGDLTLMRVTEDFQREIGFTDEEHQLLNFNQAEGNTHWNQAVDDREFEVNKTVFEAIVSVFRAMSEAKQLTLESMSLCTRFVDVLWQEPSAPVT